MRRLEVEEEKANGERKVEKANGEREEVIEVE